VGFFSSVAGALAVLGAVSSSSVWAADIVEPAGCTFETLLQGGGMITDTDQLTTGVGYRYKSQAPQTKTAFGEIATDLQCQSWTFQADAAAYGFYNSGTSNFRAYDLAIWQGHLGGSIFKRQEDLGIIGISASRVIHHGDLDFDFVLGQPDLSFKDSAGYFRLGGFSEFYANDRLTLGGGAYYIDGDWLKFADFDPDRHEKGIEAFATLKFYGSDNLAFALRGDIIDSKIKSASDLKLSGYAISAEAEYKFENSNLSAFVGARYADRSLKFAFIKHKVEDMQAFVGLRFNFGGPEYANLRERDRTGAYDNTSVFLEKLPTSAAALERVFLAREIIE
jgi:hypothetical protein